MRAADLHKLARALRETALLATGNTGSDAVSPGELAIVEDIAAHPGTAVTEVAGRTRLAQSLVSRVVAKMMDAGVIASSRDPSDARRVRLSISAGIRPVFLARGGNDIAAALTELTPSLTMQERAALIRHLDQVAELLFREPPG